MPTYDYHDRIHALLSERGAMGVNEIQKALDDVPLSSLQYFLDKKQSYFKKTPNRKWDLPEKVQLIQNEHTKKNYSVIVATQLKSINTLFETMMSQISSAVSLLEDANTIELPVAAKLPDIDQQFITTSNQCIAIGKVFKERLKQFPDEYQELVSNLDIVKLTLSKGTDYMNDVLSPTLSSVLIGEADELPSDFVEILEKFQKEK